MIYVVVGPTGVGKTKLSVMLAKKLDAVVFNADSMQVYKELNIGTAKIKKEEMEGVPHYLFDIVSISDEFNAFKIYAFICFLGIPAKYLSTSYSLNIIL